MMSPGELRAREAQLLQEAAFGVSCDPGAIEESAAS